MLYVFVEGPDDERFFEYMLREKEIKIVEYAAMKQKKITDFIKSIKAMPEDDYIFSADADGDSIEQKLEKVKMHYPICDPGKIYIVQREIESWYLAGIELGTFSSAKKKKITNTDNVSKEEFLSMIPKNYTKILFMSEILQRYNLSLACSRNKSLAYFAKCLL